jgi:GMP synthase-like glutamine amidotransferase
MKKILILQFRKNPENVKSEQGVYERAFQSLPVSLVFKNVFYDVLAWESPVSICEGADAVILGGSGDLFFDGGLNATHEAVTCSCDFAHLHKPLFAYIQERNIPLLGICFGHQLIAHMHGVRVRNDQKQAKVGSHEVVLTEEGRNDPLFEGVPSQFTAQYGHKDSLSVLPERAVLLACGEQCAYSALRLGTHCYSLQFHPELIADDMRKRYADNPSYLPPGSNVSTAIRESPHASKILHNFVFNIMHAGDSESFVEAEMESQSDFPVTTQ